MPTVKNAPAQDGMAPTIPSQKPLHYPFWFGGSAAAMATVVTHPLDLVKVRLQTRRPGAPTTMLGTFVHVARSQGIWGLYNGLSAALLRQLTYSTVRFGVYEELKSHFAPPPTPANPNPKLPLVQLVAMSSAGGFLGGIAGNPGDVLNVRMQSDFAKPREQRRNYKHVLDGLIRMIREEGPTSLMRGVGANSARALLMTAAQLASYDAFKGLLLSPATHQALHYTFTDSLLTHFTASVAAGFVATTFCSPVDVVKTRVMSMVGARVPLLQLLGDAFRTEGYLWMFRGWVPSFVRLGPQTIFTMIFFEQHKKLWRRWKGVE